MQLSVIVDSDELYIGYDSESQWLYVDWRGEHTPESSRAACLLMLETLRAHPCPKILNDNSNISQTTMQLSSWSLWWLDEMRAAGLQHIAWVLPRHMLARRGVESVVQTIEKPHVASFDDLASAYNWLRQQQVTPRS